MLMNKAEKKRFIRDFTKRVADDLIGKIDNMPEDWMGSELRQRLAEMFTSEMTPMDGKRLLNYKNALMTRDV